MANMASSVKHPYDAAKVSIAAGTSTAAGAGTNGTSVAMDRLNTAYWDNDELANPKLGVAIVVESDDTSAGVTYVVEVDTVTGFASGVTIWTDTDLAVGAYTLYFDESNVEFLESGAAFWRCTITAAAGTGSVEAGAWEIPFAND